MSSDSTMPTRMPGKNAKAITAKDVSHVMIPLGLSRPWSRRTAPTSTSVMPVKTKMAAMATVGIVAIHDARKYMNAISRVAATKLTHCV